MNCYTHLVQRSSSDFEILLSTYHKAIRSVKQNHKSIVVTDIFQSSHFHLLQKHFLPHPLYQSTLQHIIQSLNNNGDPLEAVVALTPSITMDGKTQSCDSPSIPSELLSSLDSPTSSEENNKQKKETGEVGEKREVVEEKKSSLSLDAGCIIEVLEDRTENRVVGDISLCWAENEADLENALVLGISRLFAQRPGIQIIYLHRDNIFFSANCISTNLMSTVNTANTCIGGKVSPLPPLGGARRVGFSLNSATGFFELRRDTFTGDVCGYKWRDCRRPSSQWMRQNWNDCRLLEDGIDLRKSLCDLPLLKKCVSRLVRLHFWLCAKSAGLDFDAISSSGKETSAETYSTFSSKNICGGQKFDVLLYANGNNSIQTSASPVMQGVQKLLLFILSCYFQPLLETQLERQNYSWTLSPPSPSLSPSSLSSPSSPWTPIKFSYHAYRKQSLSPNSGESWVHEEEKWQCEFPNENHQNIFHAVAQLATAASPGETSLEFAIPSVAEVVRVLPEAGDVLLYDNKVRRRDSSLPANGAIVSRSTDAPLPSSLLQTIPHELSLLFSSLLSPLPSSPQTKTEGGALEELIAQAERDTCHCSFALAMSFADKVSAGARALDLSIRKFPPLPAIALDSLLSTEKSKSLEEYFTHCLQRPEFIFKEEWKESCPSLFSRYISNRFLCSADVKGEIGQDTKIISPTSHVEGGITTSANEASPPLVVNCSRLRTIDDVRNNKKNWRPEPSVSSTNPTVASHVSSFADDLTATGKGDTCRGGDKFVPLLPTANSSMASTVANNNATNNANIDNWLLGGVAANSANAGLGSSSVSVGRETSFHGVSSGNNANTTNETGIYNSTNENGDGYSASIKTSRHQKMSPRVSPKASPRISPSSLSSHHIHNADNAAPRRSQRTAVANRRMQELVYYQQHGEPSAPVSGVQSARANGNETTAYVTMSGRETRRHRLNDFSSSRLSPYSSQSQSAEGRNRKKRRVTNRTNGDESSGIFSADLSQKNLSSDLANINNDSQERKGDETIENNKNITIGDNVSASSTLHPTFQRRHLPSPSKLSPSLHPSARSRPVGSSHFSPVPSPSQGPIASFVGKLAVAFSKSASPNMSASSGNLKPSNFTGDANTANSGVNAIGSTPFLLPYLPPALSPHWFALSSALSCPPPAIDTSSSSSLPSAAEILKGEKREEREKREESEEGEEAMEDEKEEPEKEDKEEEEEAEGDKEAEDKGGEEDQEKKRKSDKKEDSSETDKDKESARNSKKSGNYALALPVSLETANPSIFANVANNVASINFDANNLNSSNFPVLENLMHWNKNMSSKIKNNFFSPSSSPLPFCQVMPNASPIFSTASPFATQSLPYLSPSPLQKPSPSRSQLQSPASASPPSIKNEWWTAVRDAVVNAKTEVVRNSTHLSPLPSPNICFANPSANNANAIINNASPIIPASNLSAITPAILANSVFVKNDIVKP